MTIEHDEKDELFFFEEDEQQGELKYYLKDGVMDIVHTGVPYAMQNNGYGTQLIEAALKYATEKNYKIKPTCPFVREYVNSNPSAQGLEVRG
jgi:predicted GNAT family acetyltransferase